MLVFMLCWFRAEDDADADAENHIRGYDADADDDDRFEFGGAASAGYEQTDTSS